VKRVFPKKIAELDAMAGRSNPITQAELERAIRAVKAEGLPIARIVVREDGYAIETAPDRSTAAKPPRPVL
jgi:hypothetical protein